MDATRFLGAGLAGLDGGNGVAAGTVVSEQALWRLLGMMADPVSGQPLGRRPRRWPEPLSERIAARLAALPDGPDAGHSAETVARIGAEERSREASLSRPVAAFDLTFSVPKSVSTLWAVADAATQEVIVQAHREAVQIALRWAERNVVFTRTGAGGLVQEDVRGVVAAAFDHPDSRAGDPHLHTHVVVANRVHAADGTWRSADSKTLFRYTVALSELHEGLVQDLLTTRLGVAWTARSRGHSAVPRHDIAGVPSELLEEFSSRSRDILAAKDELVADFAARHGRQPTNVEVLKLRQHATLATRPAKEQVTLAERMAQWRGRATRLLGYDATEWSRAVLARTDLPELTAATFDAGMLDEIARVALEVVAHKRATFGHANVLAEVHRQLHGIRFAAPADRLATADRVTARALQAALPLQTPAAAEPTPVRLQRADGTSKLQHRGADKYTTAEIMDAETRLLDAARNLTAPAIDPSLIDARRDRLGVDQAAAICSIAASGRTLDLLVGPAGTGKTTSLSALRQAWETVHGPGSVTGVAPSAAAAQVLADELAIATDNTAKWLHEQTHAAARGARIDRLRRDLAACSSLGSIRARRLAHQLTAAETEHRKWTISPGQLVIVDEASLAGTVALDRIVTTAREAGAKVLLAGDWAQLGAIAAGGAFHMLANDRPDTPELATVRRFTEQWEADASTRLRRGDPTALDTYLEHGRIHTRDHPNGRSSGGSGSHVEAIQAAFDNWRADTDAGLNSILIATDDATVRELNALAQAHARDTGTAQPGSIRIADGHTAGIGDRIVTRRNDRTLTYGQTGSWVKNGDTWTITQARPDGSVAATSHDQTRSVVLSADYIAAHVELAYATTTYRAQGRTVDTAHALIDTRATRETLYVAATRARTGNHIYLDTTANNDPDTTHDEEPADPRQALETILARTATAASAHAAITKTDPSETTPSWPGFSAVGLRSARPASPQRAGPRL